MVATHVAVITGDVINSTQYELDNMLLHIKSSLNYVLRDSVAEEKFEINRGDSFQFFITDARLALQKAIELRAHLCTNRVPKKREHNGRLDVRLSIGISDEPISLRPTLGETSGTAFMLSGRSLDSMKKKRQNIVVSSANQLFDKWLNVSLHLAEQSIANWSVDQARVVLASLRGETQQTIADSEKITQAAVNQRLSKANWPAIKDLLTVYPSAIARLYDNS